MTDQMRNLMILLAGIVVILIAVIILFSGKSPFRKIVMFFLEDQAESEDESMANSSPNAQKSTSEPIVEMATLIRKSDDRLRVIESSGQEEIKDAYYELVFVSRKGYNIVVECSAEAYEKVPFNQQGSLTYKKNTLVKFKIYEDTIYN